MKTNKDLKVAYILKMFPRISETFILNEMLELERQGIELTIISLKKPNEGKFHPQLSDLKAPVYYLEDLDSKKWVPWLSEVWPYLKSKKENFWRLMERFIVEGDNKTMEYALESAWTASKIIENDIKHIHSHFGSLSSTIAYLASRIASVPFSFTAHAKDIYVYNMNEHLLTEKLFASSFVVTVTEYNRDFLYSQNPELDPAKVKIIKNGVALENVKFVPAQAREKNLILSVGRLVPKKGFDTLIDACGILKNRDISFRCIIAGNGPDADMLLERRNALGLDDAIEFTGAMTQDQILELMGKATMLCLPCRIAPDGNRDALPTVLLESLARGLPAVSTSISGIPEIIDSGINGVLVDPDDPASTANEMERLLNSGELREKYSKAGLQKAKECFDIRRNVGLLRALFADSVEGGSIMKSLVKGAPDE